MSRYSDEDFGIPNRARGARYQTFVATRGEGEYDLWCTEGGDARIARGFDEAERSTYYRRIYHPNHRIPTEYHCYRVAFPTPQEAFAFLIRHSENIDIFEGLPVSFQALRG